MKKLLLNFALAALIVSQVASAAVYGLFSPATGVLIGSSSTWVTNAATFPESVSFSTPAIELSGDVASPGNSMLYGTNASGVKGWYTQPGGGTSTGTFSGTLTGMSAGGTGTVTYWVTNGVACLFGNFTGTSNATTMTLTGLPAAVVPTRPSVVFVALENNTVQLIQGFALPSTGSSIITFGFYTAINVGAEASFTSTGTKGFDPAGSFFCYPL